MTLDEAAKRHANTGWKMVDGSKEPDIDDKKWASFISGANWQREQDITAADSFAIGFAAWSTYHPDAERYKAAGISAYDLLQKYKSRPFVDNDTSKQ